MPSRFWPAWRRVPKGDNEGFDCDDGWHVERMTPEQVRAMLTDWNESDVLLMGNMAKAVREATEPPPSTKLQRAEDARALRVGRHLLYRVFVP